MEKVRILWTGGWDSTFRMVELGFRDVIVQPVYVLDPNRTSHNCELKAMKKILDILRNDSRFVAEYNDLKVFKLEDIPKDEKITNAYKIISKETKLGSQYDWLARLGKMYSGMEMGIEKALSGSSRAIDTMNKYCHILYKNEGEGYVAEDSSEVGKLVLGWFSFPIIQRSEVDMVRQIKEWHCEDVMQHIWFCHNPIDGKPCGFCRPCQEKVASDMEWLFPEKAQKRYRLWKKLTGVLGQRVGTKLMSVLFR